MCWVTVNRKNTYPHFAKEDIHVQKVVELGIDVYKSPLMDFTWEKNKVQYTYLGVPKIQGDDTTLRWTIDYGFHSCKKIYNGESGFRISTPSGGKTLLIAKSVCSRRIIVDAVIPKGSMYYVNEYGLYVSAQLKIIGEVQKEEEKKKESIRTKILRFLCKFLDFQQFISNLNK